MIMSLLLKNRPVSRYFYGSFNELKHLFRWCNCDPVPLITNHCWAESCLFCWSCPEPPHLFRNCIPVPLIEKQCQAPPFLWVSYWIYCKNLYRRCYFLSCPFNYTKTSVEQSLAYFVDHVLNLHICGVLPSPSHGILQLLYIKITL